MSFAPFVCKDSRINDITSRTDYAVFQGGAHNTYQSYPSTSASSSSISFNVNPPSESVVISREVMIESTIKFQARIGNVAIGQKALLYGENDALQAFPFNSLIQTASVSINNTNLSTNLQDVKDGILKCIPQRDLGHYQDTTPTLLDSTYKVQSTATTRNTEINGYYNAGYDKELVPRGAHPLKVNNVAHYVANSLKDALITAEGDRVSTEYWIIDMEVTVTEPLMVSPFIFGKPNYGSEQGLYGVNQLNIVLNMDAAMRRFWSTRNPSWTYSFTPDPTTPYRANLLLNYLTLQPGDCVDAKNVVPYLEYPRYITPITNTPSILNGASASISCANIQLSKVPDTILVFARKPIAAQTASDTASFLPITNVSVNFNNQSGLLASASNKDLYKMSKRNGVCQSWYEWSGYAMQGSTTNNSGIPTEVATIGSVLAINPAYDLSLPPTIANGSSGQFNLQINLTVTNNSGATLTPEIVIVAISSGLLTTIAGNSSLSSGFLTSTIVMDAQHSTKVSRSLMQRHVGGSLFSAIGSLLKTIPGVGEVVSALGGKRGGSMSAGAKSAGAKMDSFVKR